jgi:hypothetical protein
MHVLVGELRSGIAVFEDCFGGKGNMENRAMGSVMCPTGDQQVTDRYVG